MASLEPHQDTQTHIIIDKNEDQSRLDRALCRLLGQQHRTLIMRLIRKGNVRVNGKRAKINLRLQQGDSIFLPASLRPSSSPAKADIDNSKQPPRPIRNLEVLYEDADILVINKEAGLVVHGG
ncbi:MAG: S4 domain-containing protein, partial [Mariprofundaceae bacterium]|nr:S4 domain-containing protein [Mariprofundaceae bacterium]